MRLLTTMAWIAVNAVLASLLSPLAAAQDSATCTGAIAAAKNRLESGRQVEVRLLPNDLSDSYPDHPPGRPDGYTFAMSGPATTSVMNSPQLMKSIANDVISRCQTVGAVGFALYQSGWSYSIGLLPGRDVDFFHCLDHPGRRVMDMDVDLKWGEEYCSL